MVELCPRRRIQRRMLVLRRCIRRLMDRLFMSCLRKTVRYRMLPQAMILSPPADASVAPAADAGFESASPPPDAPGYLDADSDLVPLKISLLGDCNIGKTSFLVKYVGDEKGKGEGLENGLNSIDKTLVVGGARISYSIWEVGGDSKSQDHIPIACKDSVAILFMFDLTSRCTLNSVIGWYQEARKWNQTAIPVLIGTKFDDFIQLPIDLQWTIASQVGKSDLAWCIMCNRQGRMRRPSMQHCSFLVQPITLMSTRCSNSSRPKSSTCHGLWSAISPLENRLSISSLFILCIERTFPISGEVIKSYFRICFL